jgi:hypothetical protein
MLTAVTPALLQVRDIPEETTRQTPRVASHSLVSGALRRMDPSS